MAAATAIGVEAWKGMFRELGLSDADMRRWHLIFEARHPDGHQQFLTWLGLTGEHIARLRRDCRDATRTDE
jgi:hypothetical protein